MIKYPNMKFTYYLTRKDYDKALLGITLAWAAKRPGLLFFIETFLPINVEGTVTELK